MKIHSFFVSAFCVVILSSLQCFEVVIGKTEVVQDCNCTEIITYNDHTYLKWDTFNIAENETIRFVQPNDNSCVLNKVLFEPSKIFGSLESNGKVFLLNPNGIIFGENAKVQVNSFIASTLDIADFDAYFQNKEIQFESGSGSIINLGNIEAVNGEIFLVSNSIQNAGRLIASNGEVNLAAATKVMIRPKEDKKIYLLSSEISSQGRIDNSGEIFAKQIIMTAENNPYEIAIKHSGIIEATSLDKQKSAIYLAAENSQLRIVDESLIKINNHSGVLAEVQLLGKEVYIEDKSIIDVSCCEGGGRIYIGGGYQGKDPMILKSDLTFIGKDVRIFADAKESGNGGNIIVWSDGTSSFFGFISVKGGQISGDGGFIEVSGRKYLIFEGDIDTKASNGKIGTLLLDPTDIFIIRSEILNGYFNEAAPLNSFIPSASFSYINREDLYRALDNANVLIDTTSIFNGEGDIVFPMSFYYIATGSRGGSLTLNAGHDICLGTSFLYQPQAAANATFLLKAQNLIQLCGDTKLYNSAAVFTANDIMIKSDFKVYNFNKLSLNASNDVKFATSNFNFSFMDNAVFSITAGNTITIDNSLHCSNCLEFTLSAPNGISLNHYEFNNLTSISFTR
jgi:filamentous hemagglutinin family protein